MFKKVLIGAGLLVALVVGVASARISDDQSEKQKSKDKSEQKSQSYIATEPIYAFSLTSSEGGYLGVFLEEVTVDRAKELGLSEERGAVVMKVVKDSPAEKAGLKENDVIVGFNSRRVDSVRELHRLLAETPAGRNVSLEVIRGGSHQTLSASLTKRTPDWSWKPEFDDKIRKSTEEAMKRAEEQLQNSEEALKHYKDAQDAFKNGLAVIPRDYGNFFSVGPGQFGFFSGGRLGVAVESLTEQLANYFGVKESKGVLVTQVDQDSAAEKAGLKAGDVITAIDNESVDGVDSLIRAIGKKEEGQVSLRIVRNKAEQTLTVTLEKRQRGMRPMQRRRASLASAAVSAEAAD